MSLDITHEYSGGASLCDLPPEILGHNLGQWLDTRSRWNAAQASPLFRSAFSSTLFPCVHAFRLTPNVEPSAADCSTSESHEREQQGGSSQSTHDAQGQQPNRVTFYCHDLGEPSRKIRGDAEETHRAKTLWIHAGFDDLNEFQAEQWKSLGSLITENGLNFVRAEFDHNARTYAFDTFITGLSKNLECLSIRNIKDTSENNDLDNARLCHILSQTGRQLPSVKHIDLSYKEENAIAADSFTMGDWDPNQPAGLGPSDDLNLTLHMDDPALATSTIWNLTARKAYLAHKASIQGRVGHVTVIHRWHDDQMQPLPQPLWEHVKGTHLCPLKREANDNMASAMARTLWLRRDGSSLYRQRLDFVDDKDDQDAPVSKKQAKAEETSLLTQDTPLAV